MRAPPPRALAHAIASALVLAACNRGSRPNPIPGDVVARAPASAMASSAVPPAPQDAGASASGTASTNVDAPMPPRQAPAKCQRPLGEFCRGAPCPSYDKSAAELRALIAGYRATDSGCPPRAELGTCGALKYVSQHDGYAGHTEYFDRAGTLVAAERSSDTNSFCNGRAFEARYGTHAECTRVVRENLCAGLPPNETGL